MGGRYLAGGVTFIKAGGISCFSWPLGKIKASQEAALRSLACHSPLPPLPPTPPLGPFLTKLFPEATGKDPAPRKSCTFQFSSGLGLKANVAVYPRLEAALIHTRKPHSGVSS